MGVCTIVRNRVFSLHLVPRFRVESYDPFFPCTTLTFYFARFGFDAWKVLGRTNSE